MDSLTSLRVHLPASPTTASGCGTPAALSEPESKVAPGVSMGMQQAGDAAAASAAPMQILEEAVGKLRRAGAKKALVGERHWRAENLDILNAALRGALRAAPSEKLVFYREVHEQNVGKEDAIEAALVRPEVKAQFVGPFANVVARGHVNRQPASDKECASAKTFSSLIGRPQVSIRLLSFFNRDRTDLRRFAADSDFAMASLGYAHALHGINAADRATVPWSGSSQAIPAGYHASTIGRVAQKAMFAALEHAQQAAPTILIASSGILQGDGEAPSTEEHARFIRHYVDQGYAVLEVPGALVMAQESFLPTLRGIVTKYPAHSRVHCTA